MSSEFDLSELKQILKDCPEYEHNHHLGRLFMSAYQIAIQFAEDHPQYSSVKNRQVGGKGKGPSHSLVQRIAIFLSKSIKDGKAPDIEGGFISHGFIGELWFDHKGQRVEPSRNNVAHSIFRYAP